MDLIQPFKDGKNVSRKNFAEKRPRFKAKQFLQKQNKVCPISLSSLVLARLRETKAPIAFKFLRNEGVP